MKLSKSVIGVTMASLLLVGGISFIALSSGRQTKADQNTASKPTAAPQSKPAKQPTAEPVADVKHYNNEAYGVSFDYPSDWIVEENTSVNSGGPVPTEFSMALNFDTTGKYPTAVVFEVLSKDYSSMTSFYEDGYKKMSTATVEKADTIRSGKQGIHYSVTYTLAEGSSKAERYLFKVGDKTYSLSSINEELNQQRDGAYWDKFSKIYDSLQLR